MEGRKVDDPGSQGVDRAGGVSSELVGFTVLSSSLQEVKLVLRTESSGQGGGGASITCSEPVADNRSSLCLLTFKC